MHLPTALLAVAAASAAAFAVASARPGLGDMNEDGIICDLVCNNDDDCVAWSGPDGGPYCSLSPGEGEPGWDKCNRGNTELLRPSAQDKDHVFCDGGDCKGRCKVPCVQC